MTEIIHIGKLIQAKMKTDGRSAQWLAQQLHCETSNIYKIYEKPTINTGLLLRISKALNIDFFANYSNLLIKGQIT